MFVTERRPFIHLWRGEDLKLRPSGYETYSFCPTGLCVLSELDGFGDLAWVMRHHPRRAAERLTTLNSESVGFSWDLASSVQPRGARIEPGPRPTTLNPSNLKTLGRSAQILRYIVGVSMPNRCNMFPPITSCTCSSGRPLSSSTHDKGSASPSIWGKSDPKPHVQRRGGRRGSEDPPRGMGASRMTS